MGTLFDAGRIALAILGVVTFFVIAGYVFFGGIYRTFQRIGFTPREASLILFGTFVGSFFDIPLTKVNGWTLAVNVGGAIVPIVVCFLLLRRRPSIGLEAVGAATAVAIATYLVTYVTPEGIASPFPLYLIPPIVAAAVSLGAFWREESFAAPLAYIGGTMGALVGGDFIRLPEFLAQTPPAADVGSGVASIGGAAVLDMVYLAGIIAVAVDFIFFWQVHRQREKHTLPQFHEDVVFTASTPPEVIAAYKPRVPSGTSYASGQASRPSSTTDRRSLNAAAARQAAEKEAPAGRPPPKG